MPLADYTCECGHKEIDVYQKKIESIECPKCGKMMERVFTGRLGFNANKLKMDREHETWVESKSQRLSSKEI